MTRRPSNPVTFDPILALLFTPNFSLVLILPAVEDGQTELTSVNN